MGVEQSAPLNAEGARAGVSANGAAPAPTDLFRYLAQQALLLAVYFAAGIGGLRLAFDHPSASPVWPPTGIALAALLILGHRAWPAIFLGAFLVNQLTSGSILVSIGIAIGNTCEALLGAWLVNKYANGRNPFASGEDVARFIVFAAFGAPVVSATVGVTCLGLGGLAAWGNFGSVWLTWWLGDAVGALVVAPLILVWVAQPRLDWTLRQALEAAGWLALVVVSGLLAFSAVSPLAVSKYPLAFFHIALVLGIAIRFGLREAVTGLAVLAGIAIWGTVEGYGVFAQPRLGGSLVMMQMFVGVGAILILVQGAVISGRRSAEQRLQALFDDAVMGIAEWDASGRYTQVNRQYCELLQCPQEHLLHHGFMDFTHPDDLETNLLLFNRLKTLGIPYKFEKRYLRADGKTIWVRKTVSRVVVGRTPHFVAMVEDISLRKEIEEARRLTAVLEERNRMAGEIHDGIAQALVAIGLQLENAESSLGRSAHDIHRHLNRARELAQSALHDARRSIQSLRPHLLDNMDLPHALEAAATQLFAGNGIELEFACEGTPCTLTPETERDLFYIAREGLANALRHAGAHKVCCLLRYEPAEVQIRISDDGRGFDTKSAAGFGLENLQTRARRIGAVVSIESAAGKGSTLLARLPVTASGEGKSLTATP